VRGEVDVSIGRLAAASRGASGDGGVRSALGIPGPERSVTLPGAPDSGRTELVVGDAGPGRATYQGVLDRSDGAQILPQFHGESLQPNQARTYEISTQPDSAIVLHATGKSGVAAVRRTFGPGGDQGS